MSRPRAAERLQKQAQQGPSGFRLQLPRIERPVIVGIGRAETLLHEARHRGGKSHDATFPAGSVFGEGKSGADSTWGYEGAWMYGALYLWWFYADGRRTTTALRQAARQRANLVIDNAFATHPGFTIA